MTSDSNSGGTACLRSLSWSQYDCTRSSLIGALAEFKEGTGGRRRMVTSPASEGRELTANSVDVIVQ